MDQQIEPEFGSRMSAYSPTSVTKTESAGVAWSSVLRAWDGQICPNSDPAVVAAYTTQVRAEWQAAVGRVAEAYGFDERRKKNVLLCSPYWMFSWWKGGRQWGCDLPNVCPWCWSGRVVGSWDSLVKLMYADDGSGPAEFERQWLAGQAGMARQLENGQRSCSRVEQRGSRPEVTMIYAWCPR